MAIIVSMFTVLSGMHRARHTPAHRHTLHSISVILQFRSNWHRDRHNASKQPQRKCSRRTKRKKKSGENGKKIEIRFFWRAISQFTITGERDVLYPLESIEQFRAVVRSLSASTLLFAIFSFSIWLCRCARYSGAMKGVRHYCF